MRATSCPSLVQTDNTNKIAKYMHLLLQKRMEIMVENNEGLKGYMFVPYVLNNSGK